MRRTIPIAPTVLELETGVPGPLCDLLRRHREHFLRKVDVRLSGGSPGMLGDELPVFATPVRRIQESAVLVEGLSDLDGLRTEVVCKRTRIERLDDEPPTRLHVRTHLLQRSLLFIMIGDACESPENAIDERLWSNLQPSKHIPGDDGRPAGTAPLLHEPVPHVRGWLDGGHRKRIRHWYSNSSRTGTVFKNRCAWRCRKSCQRLDDSMNNRRIRGKDRIVNACVCFVIHGCQPHTSMESRVAGMSREEKMTLGRTVSSCPPLANIAN